MVAQANHCVCKTHVHGSGAGLTRSVAFLVTACVSSPPASRCALSLCSAMAMLDPAVISAIAQAVTVAMQASKESGGRAHHNALGGPPEWDSARDESAFMEWHVKVKAWLTNQDDRALRWLNTARDADVVLETDDLDVANFSTDAERHACKKFNGLLYNLLVTKLKGEAFNIVSSVRDASGLEAWRLLMRRYEPRTPGTKRALLKTLFNMKAAKKIEEIEKNLLRVEEIFARYEVMSKAAIPEDIKTVIMTELCTPELKEYLEFNNKDYDYKETREAVMSYVERKRKDPLTAMEVGNHECDHAWWGDIETDYQYPENDFPYHDMDQYVNELNYNGYKGKGKGWSSKGKGKGPSKGMGKNGFFVKGGGKDKGKGKGKKGSFQGECHWCGKWGHTASRCPDKDEYMEWVRRTNALGKGGSINSQLETNHIHTQADGETPWKAVGSPVAMLEAEHRYVDIGTMDKHFPKLSNRFSALSVEEVDEHEPMKVMVPKPYKVKEAIAADPCNHRRPRRRWTKLEVGAIGKVTEISHVIPADHMELTIDSGAGENVMPEHMAPYTPVQQSKEAGVLYTAANGDTMPNRGCKRVKITTQEGQLRTMNMQVTDVNRALMSVAKICDAGHTVTFTTDGGVIRNNQSGEETKFRRENNVYRMTVKLNETGFTRQG